MIGSDERIPTALTCGPSHARVVARAGSLPILRPAFFLGLALLLLLTQASVARAGDPPARPNVILITIDTLRADHVGRRGREDSLTPQIDAFANGATVFETAYSQAPNTIPSLLQIMTSRYGMSGQVQGRDIPLAEMLNEQGYETLAIVDNPLVEFDARAHGLSRGFDVFLRNGLVDRSSLEGQHWKSNTAADVVTSQARRMLAARKDDRPLFLWLHYFDPHDPYAPPFGADIEEISWKSKSKITGDVRSTSLFDSTRGSGEKLGERDFEQLRRLYRAEVRYVDQSVGELFALLREGGLFDESLIVLSSDHGESLGEHGIWTHGRSLFDTEIRIPLILKRPGQREGARLANPVQAIDIYPTIVDQLAIETPYRFDGRSLLAKASGMAMVIWLKKSVVRTERWKLYERDDRAYLYDMEKDPGESRDVAPRRAGVVAKLRSMRDARLAAGPTSAAQIRELSQEAADQMRALGYLE
jgi:arylsulfatase A-like enzyme